MIRAFIEDYRILKTKHPRHIGCLKWLMIASITVNIIFINGFFYQYRKNVRAPSIAVQETVTAPVNNTLNADQQASPEAQADTKIEVLPAEPNRLSLEATMTQRLESLEAKVAHLEGRAPATQPNTDTPTEVPATESVTETHPASPEAPTKPARFGLHVFKTKQDQS